MKKFKTLGINNKKFIIEQKNKIPTKVIMGLIEITFLESNSQLKLENKLKILCEVEFIPIPNKNKNIESKNIAL